jgi:hypothetical protein
MDTFSIPRAFCLLACSAGNLWAQAPSAPQAKTEAAYLLRIERVRNREGVCVLLRGDGQYHLERHTPDKVRVFEGDLDSEEIHPLVRIVSGDPLYRLEQKQITDPMLRSDDDLVILAVLRPLDKWQELVFPDSPSREPYRESLVPLLDWLDHMQKRKGRELSEEEGRNNCRPFVNLKFATRPGTKGEAHTGNTGAPDFGRTPGATTPGPTGGGTAEKSYVLLMFDSAFVKGTIEMSCTLVTSSGAYHFVKQSRDRGSHKVRSRVLDAAFNETQIAALRQVLVSSELRSPPSDPRPSELILPDTDGPSHTVVSFPRDGAIQTFEAWQSLQIVPGRITHTAREHGMKTLLPLRQWLNVNVDLSKAVSMENPPNAHCLPEP